MAQKYLVKKPASGYMCYIELTKPDLRRLAKNGNRRVICLLNKKVEIHAAIMKNKNLDGYIMIAGKYLKQLGVRVNESIEASFRIDDSPLQFNMPEEFEEVIGTDEEAKKVFESLSPGSKRGLIALVNMVKSPDKKIERALYIARQLKRGITSPRLIMKRE